MSSGKIGERGILTDEDIAFLKGNKPSYSSAQASKARKRIRERVAAAMFDFKVLAEHWSAKQLRKTFDLIDDTSNEPIDEVGANMVATLYMILNAKNAHPEFILEDDQDEKLLQFRLALGKGISKGQQGFGHSPEVVSLAATTSFHEVPDKEEVQEEVDSAVLTDIQRRMNEKYRNSAFYEDDETIVDDIEDGIRDYIFEWKTQSNETINYRYNMADDFRYPVGQKPQYPVGYHEDINTDLGSGN